MLNSLFSFDKNCIIQGLTSELNIFYIYEAYQHFQKNILVVTSSLYETNQIYNSLETYTDHVLLFPMDDFLTSVAVAVSPELQMKRLETLEKIKHEHWIIITNLTGYLRFLPDLSKKSLFQLGLSVGTTFSRDKLHDLLLQYGYKQESLVTSTGEIAIRGFVVDLFPIYEEHPIRIEFFGDEIESIRRFDESSQTSLEVLNEIIIHPYQEMNTDSKSNLIDYLDKPVVIYKDYQQIKISAMKLEEEILQFQISKEEHGKKYMFSFDEISPDYEIYLNAVLQEQKKDNLYHYDSKEIENFNGNFDLLKEYVLQKLHLKKKIIFCLSKESQIKHISNLFSQCEITYQQNKIYTNVIHIWKMKMNHGFEIQDFVVISEFDIEKVQNTTIHYKNNYRIGRKINTLDSLKTGDYVVHRMHGIGIYFGVVTLTQYGVKKDYIQINYFGNDKVYIPVEKISTIYKYTDKDGMKPQVNKLNSPSWVNKKRAIQKRIHDISDELIRLYAARNQIQGEIYMDYEEEAVFASYFPYMLTRDQERAIQDIDRDLKNPVPMDRLLCGDVGFGKTEVAFRAIFKAILNNKQVFYLCPTTILSKQQYESASARFSEYPLEIALLNRFTTVKETKRILNDLKTGKIDLVFGTHRLLSEDVQFQKLGLLIVDEEQRFGVTHKEKIKKFKNDVNVLTLSATPIPRTLKMALSGLRDLSIIDTAPVNRYPVQTYVIEENFLLIKDAIYKELSRQGQIFILYNQISSIDKKMAELQKLVPEARITFAHGRMTKKELEDIMTSFVNYEFDILLCTTIIETGIDIPNANTLIIYDADHFGLSQLYQLRGRVGRSNKIAYAYLMYNPSRILNEIAVKRLQAIKEFTELGSGYRIAMRDLSIRGAGDLLGSEQAGFVDTVGISLYMKMVEEEMMRLRGEEVLEEEDTKSLLNVETHISDNYVSDEDLKIEIHQKINEIDSYDKLLEVKTELEDRFGKISNSIEVYMYEEWFEKLANRLNITKVVQSDREITIEIPEEISSMLKGDKLFLEVYNINPKFQLKYLNKRIIIQLSLKGLEKHFVYYVVPLMDKILQDILPFFNN
ncbi:MAG: transcription-repair coupling factor [Bacilli bacterium]|nr:transcription-repair coupling factor [Bacilli bacterium]